MKWFKHHSDAYTNLKTQSVIAEHGMSGYGFYWVCVEMVAQQGENHTITGEKGWKRSLVYTTRINPEKADILLSFFAENRLIDAEALARGDLFIPKLAEYGDEYSTRKVSRHSPDNVVLDKKRIEENRRDESKPHLHLEYLINLPFEDIKALTAKYDASTAQVKRKAEQFWNYCVSKGKTYKNYRAALENALDKDFGRKPAEKPIETYERQELTSEAIAMRDKIAHEMRAKTQTV